MRKGLAVAMKLPSSPIALLALILLVFPLLAGFPARAAEPARKQATIKGLLVVQLGDGSFAGAASQMNATVVPGKSGEFKISFNQRVGEMMKKATAEVEKFIRVRHPEQLPLGKRLELAFADKYSPKDGPSAAVVCALLVDSIITGDEIDQGFAATGDMTAAGQVRPIGGLTGKIRGAIKKECSLMGAPKANEQSINDLYLIEGIKPLYQIQIFTLATFEEAREIAMTTRGEDMQKAIDEFALVQKALKRNEAYLNNAKVREKLRAIVKLAPNHASARLLYLHSVGKAPKLLSLPGSLAAIEEAAGSFGTMLQDGSYEVKGGHDDVLTGLVNEIARMRPTLDRRTRPYCDAYEEFAAFVKDMRDRKYLKPSEYAQMKSMINTINSERNKLMNDKEVREELMLE